MAFYHGNEEGQTLGILPGPPPNGPYYWWQAGALWGTMIDYWKYTGDEQYNQIVQEALLSQVGPDQNYLEPNITASIGNDDQAFWGVSAILAAESGFQNPSSSEPQWLSLAQAVYNIQKYHLDEETACGGGLRWQVLVMNNGYNYKNSIANGAFFNIAARLARYTGDDAYAGTARSTFQWMKAAGLIDPDYNVWDGAHVEMDCKDINHAQFSYTAAILLQGAAFMWDFSQEHYWRNEVNNLLQAILNTFFPEGVFFEPPCEGTTNIPEGGCTQDMKFFRGFVLRWMADAAQLCPWTREPIMAAILSSAQAAVETCTGGENGRMCGMRWGLRQFNGEVDLGQETGVLSALMTTLLLLAETSYEDADYGGGHEIKPPLTQDTGGTSVGDPQAGQSRRKKVVEMLSLEGVDTVFAVILTTAVIVCAMVMFVWMCIEDTSQRKENIQQRVRPRCTLGAENAVDHRQKRRVVWCQEAPSPRTYRKHAHHSAGVA